MPDDLARLEHAETAALADAWRAAPPRLAERQGIALLETDGATALAVSSLPASRVHNHALGVATEAEMEQVEAFYRRLRCPFVLSPAPGASLGAALERRGYTRGYAWTKFALDVPPDTPAPPADVVEIGTAVAEVFGAVVASGFGMPDWTAEWIARLPGRRDWACFLWRVRREPAGAGALYVAGDVGWLGFGTTLPGFRGRGGQAALLAARVDAARARGCVRLATETGVRIDGQASASYRNILGAGFSEAATRDNWSPPSPARAP